MKITTFVSFYLLFCSIVFGEKPDAKDELDEPREALERSDEAPVLVEGLEAKAGRIMIYIEKDGTQRGTEKELLDTKELLNGYIKRLRDVHVAAGRQPYLAVMGDADLKYERCGEAIAQAVALGVNNVKYSSFDFVHDRDHRIAAKDREIKVSEEDRKKFESAITGEIPPKRLILRIDNLGRILWDADEIVALDENENVRTTPHLDVLLAWMKIEAGAYDLVIRTDDVTRYGRVMDILRASASVGVSTVSFEVKVK